MTCALPVREQIEAMEKICKELAGTQTRIPKFSIDPLVKPLSSRSVETMMYCDDPETLCAEAVYFPTDSHATEAQWREILQRAYVRLEGRVSALASRKE